MEFTKGKLKRVRIPTCLTDIEAELIKKASDKEYMSMSSFVRKCAVNKARNSLGGAE